MNYSCGTCKYLVLRNINPHPHECTIQYVCTRDYRYSLPINGYNQIIDDGYRCEMYKPIVSSKEVKDD